MVKYEIRDVVGDYGIYEDGELKLILNSRTNAEYIKAILEHEERHPNAGVPYRPPYIDLHAVVKIEGKIAKEEPDRVKAHAMQKLASCITRMILDRNLIEVKRLAKEEKKYENPKLIYEAITKVFPPEDRVWREEEKWILEPAIGPYGVDIYVCSHCGQRVRADEVLRMHFCPNCGAKMNGGE